MSVDLSAYDVRRRKYGKKPIPCPQHHHLSPHTTPLESVSLTMAKIPFIADLEGLCSRSGHHEPGSEDRLGWKELAVAIGSSCSKASLGVDALCLRNFNQPTARREARPRTNF
jgi:hypothetical protein